MINSIKPEKIVIIIKQGNVFYYFQLPWNINILLPKQT